MNSNKQLTSLEITYQENVSSRAQIKESAKTRIKEINKEINSLTDEQYRLTDIVNNLYK